MGSGQRPLRIYAVCLRFKNLIHEGISGYDFDGFCSLNSDAGSAFSCVDVLHVKPVVALARVFQGLEHILQLGPTQRGWRSRYPALHRRLATPSRDGS